MTRGCSRSGDGPRSPFDSLARIAELGAAQRRALPQEDESTTPSVDELLAFVRPLVLSGNQDEVDVVFAVLVAKKHWRKTRELAGRAMGLIDNLPGVWGDGADYLPEKKSLRNVSRRLLEIHNKAVYGMGSQDFLYSTGDRGEWDEKHPCEVCAKTPSLAHAEVFGARRLCPDCTKKPFRELPPRIEKPQFSFFQNYKAFADMTDMEKHGAKLAPGRIVSRDPNVNERSARSLPTGSLPDPPNLRETYMLLCSSPPRPRPRRGPQPCLPDRVDRVDDKTKIIDYKTGFCASPRTPDQGGTPSPTPDPQQDSFFQVKQKKARGGFRDKETKRSNRAKKRRRK